MADALLSQMTGHYGFVSFSGPANHVVDASNEGVAFVFSSQTTDAVTKLFFRYGSRTGTPPTYIIGIEGVDASGNPDGTVKGGGSPASATFTPPADTSWDGLGRWITLDNSYAPSLGETLCLTIRYSSGTIDGSNNSSFTRAISGTLQSPAMPYYVTNSAGSWSKSINQQMSPSGYATASKRYGFLGYGNWVTHTNTSGRRQACAFTMPTAFGSTYSPSGFLCFGRFGSAAATFKASVWDSSGTEIATAGTIDADAQAWVANNGNWRFVFTTQPTLNTGTKYYFGLESVSSSVIQFQGILMTEADDRLAYPLGTSRAYAAWDGSSWTETDTNMPQFDIILNDISVPSGGGGMVFVGNRGPILNGGVVVH